MRNSDAEHVDKFKSLLQMMYNNVSSSVYKNVVTYQCYNIITDDTDDKKSIEIELLAFNEIGTDKLTEYKDIKCYSTYKNIGVIELNNKTVIIFDILKQQEIEIYNEVKGTRPIYDSAVLIIMDKRLIIYSLLEMKETFNQECKYRQNEHFTQRACGKEYIAYNMRKSILICTKQGEVVKFIEKNDDANFSANENKHHYCDISIRNYEPDSGYCNESLRVYDGDYFIHKDKIFTLEEFLDFLTIKEIKRIDAPEKRVKIKGIEKVFQWIIHYEIVTNKGYKGTLSSNFLEMNLEGVCDNQNLLTEDFESIREQYLV
jgi:hypothetical protein